MQTFIAAPHASALIESMRDIGYALETALADIVDNSISAGAAQIEIFWDPEEEQLAVLDDGCGMSEAELHDAMRLGSSNPLIDRVHGDLGRFGLGLKTASFSQCRRVTVLTKQHGGALVGAIWDLDEVARRDEWIVQIPDEPQRVPYAAKLAQSGTLVLWSNLDRLLSSGGGPKHITERIHAAMQHLEVVFHRFLTGDRVRKVSILLNNRALEAWNPFPQHPAVQTGPEETIKVGEQEVRFRAYTLPHRSKLTPDEYKQFGGADGYLKNQGFYVYREGRLIIAGTWFGLTRRREVTNLARIRVDISNEMDAEWKVDVRKTSAQLPYLVRDRFKQLVERMGGGSSRVYTNRGRRLMEERYYPLWQRIKEHGKIRYGVDREHPVVSNFRSQLSAELAAEFTNVLALVESTVPVDAIFSDCGGQHADEMAQEEAGDDVLRHFAQTLIPLMRGMGKGEEQILSGLGDVEPFRSNWDRSEPILRAILEVE